MISFFSAQPRYIALLRMVCYTKRRVQRKVVIRVKNILLCYPNGDDEADTIEHAFPPLGLLYLATTIKRSCPWVNVIIHDERIRGSSENDIGTARYDVVGFSTTAWNQKRTYILAEIAKSHGALVILGGVQPAVLARSILEHRPFIDLICTGEGEQTITTLLNGCEFAQIPNAAFRDKSGEVVFTASKADAWESAGAPDRSLIDLSSYVKRYHSYGGDGAPTNIITHRGCYYRDRTQKRGCRFCAYYNNAGTFSVRTRSPESVAVEMNNLVNNFGITFIRDYGEALPVYFLKALCAQKLPPIVVEPYMRISEITDETADLLVSNNFEPIFGIEAGSSIGLKGAGKGYGIAALNNALEIIRRHEMDCSFNLILGHPEENMESLKETELWLKRLPFTMRLRQIAVMVPVPGSRYFEDAVEILGQQKSDTHNVVELQRAYIQRFVPSLSLEILCETAEYLSRIVGIDSDHRKIDNLEKEEVSAL